MRRLTAIVVSLCALAAPAAAHAVAALDRIGPADGNLDLRGGAPVAPRDAAAVAALRARLGDGAVVDVDERTGSLRMVGRLDGFLTAASDADAAAVALGFVRANLDAFGLAAADVDNLVLVRRTTTVGGIQRLFWQQRARGVPSLDSGLRANVAADGRLINVVGSAARGVRSVQVAPRLSADQARSAALRAVGTRASEVAARRSFDARATTAFANGDRAALGVLAGAKNRLAWETIVRGDDGRTYRAVVDASSGETLLRRSLTQHASGLVHRNYPGAAAGGVQASVTFPPDWIAPGVMTLTGPYAHAFADLNDNNLAVPGEETAPSAPDVWSFALDSTNANAGLGGIVPAGACGASFLCTWDATLIATRLQNQNQSATEAFFLVNNFHDWLEAAPFGFTAANGGFETTDPVATQVLDGVNAADFSGPIAQNFHIDNANMLTPPDGTPPTMQMYLFHHLNAPWTGPGSDPFLPSNGADDAGIVYHEYGHGLSNRLVVDSLGNSTLNSHQAGSMGEAWSDFYAMDYLADTSSCLPVACEPDTATSGELLVGEYVSAGQRLVRTQAIDCAVGATLAPLCADPSAVGAGGFTYGDLGSIFTGPEVHADGEIWAQLLWDIRTALGTAIARNLITRGMELSPDDPSFLDMRNAILQADTTAYAGAYRNQLWLAFATRGLGYFAGSLSSADTAPIESFQVPPPAGGPTGTLGGTAIDVQSHAPLTGARVGFAGLDSGFPGNAGATVAADGTYALPALPVATYPYLSAGGAGYERNVAPNVALVAGANTRNVELRRGWALRSGGGAIAVFTGSDFSNFGCGAVAAIDGSQGSGWASDPGGTVTIQLPALVDVTGFAVDPGAICGDPADAGTNQFQIETAPALAGPYTIAASGSFLLAQGGAMNAVAPTAGTNDVRFVRFTIISNHGNVDLFADVAEIAVHGLEQGSATAAIGGADTIELGTTVTYTDTSTGLGNSPIVTRTWTGAATGTGPTVAIKGSKRGALSLSIAVADFLGRTGSVTRALTVVDTTKPKVKILAASGRVGRAVKIRATMSDLSGFSGKATVRFGDGKSKKVTIIRGRITATHRYTKAKLYTVSVTVKDKAGNTRKVTRKVRIRK